MKLAQTIAVMISGLRSRKRLEPGREVEAEAKNCADTLRGVVIGRSVIRHGEGICFVDENLLPIRSDDAPRSEAATYMCSEFHRGLGL